MLINDPDTLAGVTAAFNAYELALMKNDLEALDALFWPSDFTVRIGPAESLRHRGDQGLPHRPRRRVAAARPAQDGDHQLRQ